jgi:CysZ protein
LLKEIIKAIQSYYRAHQFISKHRLWKWIVLPGLIYMLLFGISMYFFGKSANHVIDYLTNITGLNAWLQKMQNGWLQFFAALGGMMVWLLFMFFYFSLFKYIWLIIGSPIFAYLSEKTESLLQGKEYPFSWSQLLKDMARGIRIAIRNSLWQTVYSISILLISFIPVIGWIMPVVSLFVECYYYGFSMLDYSCERHQLSPSQSIAYIGKHRGLAIGNGLIFYLMHLVPVLGWIFAPAYAVIAATISLYYPEKDIA